MAAQDVLKEFLIAISFKQDEQGQRKLVDNIAKLEKGLIAFSLAAEAAALAVTAAMAKMAKGFEDAYYASSRTGAAVKELNAFRYAASQTGSTAEEATTAVEGLALKIRENRGFRTMVQSLTGDKSNDIARQISELGAVFSRMTSEQAHATASLMGIPEHLLLALENPAFSKFQDEYRAKADAMGLDLNKAAEKGRDLERQFRPLYTTLGLIVDAAAAKISDTLGGSIQHLTDFLDHNGQKIADMFAKIASGILNLAQRILEWVSGGSGQKFIDGLTNPKVWDAFGKTMAGNAGTMDRILHIIDRIVEQVNGPLGKLVMGRYGLGVTNDGIAAALPDDDIEKNKANPHAFTLRNGFNWMKGKLGLGGGGGRQNLTRPEQRANAAAFADELRKAGLPEEGIAAAMGSADTESSWNPRAHNDVKGGHDGHIQWDSVRWPKIKAWITSQGGDPFDSRWQARAFVAEGRAKPGDAIYDGPSTARGFAKMEASKGNLGLAVDGIRDIERFGYGEEGGRATKAQRYLSSPVTAPAAVASGGYIPKHNGSPVPIPPIKALPGDRPGWAGGFNPDAMRGVLNAPPLDSQTANDNSRSVTINNNNKTEVHGVSDPAKAADHIGRVGDRQSSLLLRNLQSAVG